MCGFLFSKDTDFRLPRRGGVLLREAQQLQWGEKCVENTICWHMFGLGK